VTLRTIHSKRLKARIKGGLFYNSRTFPFVYQVLDFLVNKHQFINPGSAAIARLKTSVTARTNKKTPATFTKTAQSGIRTVKTKFL
jgi:hypothetical protein